MEKKGRHSGPVPGAGIQILNLFILFQSRTPASAVRNLNAVRHIDAENVHCRRRYLDAETIEGRRSQLDAEIIKGCGRHRGVESRIGANGADAVSF